MRRFRILISDRNRNVREYLRRELEAEGYDIEIAASACQILDRIYRNDSVDLVIIDPDLPDAGSVPLFKKLNNSIPAMPVIVHAYDLAEFSYKDAPDFFKSVHFVEKKGQSIENMKKIVAQMLLEAYGNKE